MRWSQHLEAREARATWALAAAAALLAEPEAASRLPGWRFSDQPLLVADVTAALRAAPPSPSPAALACALAPAAALPRPPRPERDLAEHVWRAWLASRLAPSVAPSPQARLAWALAELDWHGAELDRLERRAWARPCAADPSADAAMARLWRAWFDGDLTVLWRGWPGATLGPAASVLRGMLEGLRASHAEIGSLVRQFKEDYLLICLGDEAGAPPWREIAARVVEGRGPPVRALGAALSAASWAKAGRCAAARAPWRPSLAGLEDSAAIAWVEAGDLDRIDALHDLHLAKRLLRGWSSPETCAPEPSWRLLVHHLRRSRGRLRALLMGQEDGALRAGLCARPGLHAATVRAVCQYVAAWSWSLNLHSRVVAPRAITAPCTLPRPRRRPVPRDADRQQMERAWLLLVTLRGARERLLRWLAEGGATDGTLARLLLGLPAALVDQPNLNYRGYTDLRRSLQARLPRYEAALAPALAALAALRPSRALRAEVRAALAPVWHPAIALPEHGFPTMIRNAAARLPQESAHGPPR